jgi:hypothetical protein
MQLLKLTEPLENYEQMFKDLVETLDTMNG